MPAVNCRWQWNMIYRTVGCVIGQGSSTNERKIVWKLQISRNSSKIYIVDGSRRRKQKTESCLYIVLIKDCWVRYKIGSRVETDLCLMLVILAGNDQFLRSGSLWSVEHSQAHMKPLFIFCVAWNCKGFQQIPTMRFYSNINTGEQFNMTGWMVFGHRLNPIVSCYAFAWSFFTKLIKFCPYLIHLFGVFQLRWI